MSDLKTYRGSCHCGNVSFEVRADLAAVMSCNCSLCSRAGWLLSFVPEAQFTLLSSAEQQTDYQFNKKNIHHLFCKGCGVRCFGHGTGPDGTVMFAINVRTLEGVDAESLPVHKLDGKSL